MINLGSLESQMPEFADILNAKSSAAAKSTARPPFLVGVGIFYDIFRQIIC